MTAKHHQRQTATCSVALLYPGDRAMRDRADPAESRFAALFSALAERGLRVQPAVYHDDFVDEVQTQLSTTDAVLVWHNPIEGGRRRDRLDAMLRELALQGVYVSTHPDTITRLGTKDVLFDTRDLPFGSDVQRVDNLAQLDLELPLRLRQGPRVLKQHRGHSGIGVWRVERAEPQGGYSHGLAAPCAARLRAAVCGWANAAPDLGAVLRISPRWPHDRPGLAATYHGRHGACLSGG